ncbi:MAG: outer membrane beta-barrel protein [Gammaproteobacteria bacterium]|nr:outer membrane beta-barrel protein [Gammaproteobacteria bacterium]
MLKSSLTVLALGVTLASGSALAYQEGDLILRAGAAAVDPQEDSSQLSINGATTEELLGLDSSAGVDSNTQLGLSVTYMLSNKVGVELLAATPFSHTITANIESVGTVEAAEVKHLPPTFSLQYFLLSPESRFQPYAGIGINYTTFFDEEVSADLDAVTQSLGIPGEGSLDLDDSFGFAFELGCDLLIGENLVLNAAVWKADIDTTATFKYDNGTKITADVGIDPYVYMVAAGYRF